MDVTGGVERKAHNKVIIIVHAKGSCARVSPPKQQSDNRKVPTLQVLKASLKKVLWLIQRSDVGTKPKSCCNKCVCSKLITHYPVQ